MYTENPYYAGGALQDGRHFEEIYIKRGIEDKLLIDINSKGRGAFIYGPRQSGKTSLINYIKSLGDSYAWHTSFFSGNDLQESNQLYKTFWHEFTLKNGITQKQKVPQSGSDLAWNLRQYASKVPGRKMVCFIDELDGLLSEEGEKNLSWQHFLVAIRNLKQQPGTQNLVFVFCALQGHSKFEEKIPTENSPVFNYLDIYHLNDWGLEGTEKLSALLKKTHEVDNDVSSRIHYWTGGHPYLTQRVLQDLYDSQLNILTGDSVDHVIQHIVKDDHNMDHIDRAINRLDSEAREFLKLLAQPPSSNLPLFKWNENDIRIQVLFRDGIVVNRHQHVSLRNLIYSDFLRQKFEVNIQLPTIKLERSGFHNLFWKISTALSPAFAVTLLIGLGFEWLLQTDLFQYLKAFWEHNIYINFVPVKIGLALIFGIFTYILSYIIIWSTQVYSHSTLYEVNLHKLDENVPPLSFSYNQVAKTSEQWKLSVRLVEAWHCPVKFSGQPYKMLSWIGPHECHIKTESPKGELEALFIVPFHWQTLLLPWPSNCVVPVVVSWLGYIQPVELSLIVDSKTAPFQKIATTVERYLQGKSKGS